MSAVVPAAGLAAAVYALLPPLLAAGTAVLIAAVSLSLSVSRGSKHIAGALLICAVGISVGTTGALSVERARQQHPGLPPSQIVRISGIVADHPERAEDGWAVSVRVLEFATAHIAAQSHIEITLSGTGALPAPSAPVEASIDGLAEASSGRWSARAVRVAVGEPSVVGGLRASLYSALSAAIDGSAGSGAPLLAALLLGSDDRLPFRTEELFRRGGISHVLALSGMHLAIIATMVVGITRPLLGRRGSLLAAGLAALLYTLIIGARPSLVRATVMCELALLASLSERPLRLVELLASAFLIHCLIQPAAFVSLSFQLSYLALLGISVVSPIVIRETRAWVPRAISAPVAAGIGAQVAGAPILLSVFGRIYPIGIIAGAAVAPIVAVFMGAGIAALFLNAIPLPFIAPVTRTVLETLSRLVTNVAWWFSAGDGFGSPRLAVPAMVFSATIIIAGIACEWRRVVWTGRK